MFSRTTPVSFSLIRRPVASSSLSSYSVQNLMLNPIASASFTSSYLHLVSSIRSHGVEGDKSKPVPVRIEFADGTEKTFTAYEGQSLIDIAHDYDLPVEAACAGSIACSTCHCYLENDEAMKLFDEPTDEEYDMLDQAYMPTPFSRLGCQLKVKKGVHDNIKFKLPKATRNMAVDGYVAKGH